MQYGLYLHIPYCQSRCRYCDFHAQPASGIVPDVYVEALLRDFPRYAPKDSGGNSIPPATVYFGGGTPSLLSPQQVNRLLEAIAPQPGAEVTLEANPESAREEKLAGWRAAGVNRLSFGIQTASDESLARLGRLHRAEDAKRALAAARAAGFCNISADIMLALPGYSQQELDSTIQLLAAGGVDHVSAYMLKIEANTPFGKRPPLRLPSEDEAADFYLTAVEGLEAGGWAQYEISNFARPGYESRHNLLYWNMDNWLGLGPASHSSMNGRRFAFASDTAAFLDDTLTPRPHGPVVAQDYIMMRLRLREGLQLPALARRFGAHLNENQQTLLATLERQALAQKTQDGWALTPAGMLVQNAILGQLFA